MTQKKVIPVKYFYYGILLCVLLIASLFFYLWMLESNAQKALNERGITANAWIINLYETKASKKSSPNYYMEVGFFADTTKKLSPIAIDTISKTKTTSDKLLESLAKKTESLRQPSGDYETQTINIVSYQIYKGYKINDKIRVQFLPEDHSIIALLKN